MMLLAQFLRPPDHMPTSSMDSHYMPHHVEHNHQPVRGAGRSTSLYPGRDSQGGMSLFQQPLNNGARSCSETDPDYFAF